MDIHVEWTSGTRRPPAADEGFSHVPLQTITVLDGGMIMDSVVVCHASIIRVILPVSVLVCLMITRRTLATGGVILPAVSVLTRTLATSVILPVPVLLVCHDGHASITRTLAVSAILPVPVAVCHACIARTLVTRVILPVPPVGVSCFETQRRRSPVVPQPNHSTAVISSPVVPQQQLSSYHDQLQANSSYCPCTVSELEQNDDEYEMFSYEYSEPVQTTTEAYHLSTFT